ncbi:MAG: ISL3 family transposase [Acidobacteriota bacterium]
MKRSWSECEWLPNAGTLTLIAVTTTSAGIVVEAEGPSYGRCPACGRRSDVRHSRYWRSLKDLAAQGRSVVLRVHVTRWRCRNGCCAAAIFADRLVGVSAAHVHHTSRCGSVIHLVGHALGGRGGERLLARLGMAVSDDTILRLLKRPAEPSTPELVHVVGIDVWAWQKGQQHFGTILVDLERRRVIDLLPTRAAGSVATWLAARPSIHTISRDRHGPYAEGIRGGAPQAREVADRFHLVSNLRDVVQQELGRLRRFLVVPHHPPARVMVPRHVAPRLVRRTPSNGVRQERGLDDSRRAVQLERFHLVKRLQAAGLSAAAIMRETGIGRKLVLTWIRLRELPVRNRMAPRPGMPEFYREYLWRRWTAGCQSVKRLMAEIQPLGYVGGYAGLAKLVARWRYDAAALTRPRRVAAAVAVAVTIVTRHVSPQVAAALLGQPRPLLTARQAEIVDALKHHCPGCTTMRRLMLSFRTILRVGKVPTLHRWMARATATEIDGLQRFVRKLRQDLGAVEGAVTERWSNGPVDGHINRLKTLRRQMYGRAGVDLLRARLLPLVHNAAR